MKVGFFCVVILGGFPKKVCEVMWLVILTQPESFTHNQNNFYFGLLKLFCVCGKELILLGIFGL